MAAIGCHGIISPDLGTYRLPQPCLLDMESDRHLQLLPTEINGKAHQQDHVAQLYYCPSRRSPFRKISTDDGEKTTSEPVETVLDFRGTKRSQGGRQPEGTSLQRTEVNHAILALNLPLC